MNRSLVHRIPWEAVAWTTGLLALGLTNPETDGLLNLCFFKAIGLPWCPGCGVGHSIAWCLQGSLSNAFAAHPLGPPALVVLSVRIIGLWRESFHPSITVRD